LASGSRLEDSFGPLLPTKPQSLDVPNRNKLIEKRRLARASFDKEKNCRYYTYRNLQIDKGFVLTFLIIFLVVIFIRQIWLFSVIERDEGGIALVSLQWINGLLPYVNSFNNAGPLAYVAYLVSTLLFGTNFIPIRLINNTIFFLSIIPFYLCTKDWFDKNVALISSFFYGIFMSAPIYEGQLVLTSSLSAPIVVFCVFFCSRYLMKNSRKALVTSAFLLSIATLIKVLVAPGFFLLIGAVALRYLHNTQKNHHAKELLKDLLIVVLGFSILPIIFVLYFAWMGASGNLIAVFISSAIGHQSLPDVPFGISLYVVAQGLPLWIFAILGFRYSFSKWGKFRLFLIGWIIFAVVIAAFPPHFGHRYIYLVAPVSILAGVGALTTYGNLRFGLKKRSYKRFII
jgi:4-amino-4-deoxy-L-arabinose transferase-like glycosyltransferase